MINHDQPWSFREALALRCFAWRSQEPLQRRRHEGCWLHRRWQGGADLRDSERRLSAVAECKMIQHTGTEGHPLQNQDIPRKRLQKKRTSWIMLNSYEWMLFLWGWLCGSLRAHRFVFVAVVSCEGWGHHLVQHRFWAGLSREPSECQPWGFE